MTSSADRGRKLRKSIALGGTLGLLTLVFLQPVRLRVDVAFWSHIYDLGHIPMIGWLAVVVLYALPERVRTPVQRQILAFAVATAFALGIECLQPCFGRSRSFVDAVNGAIGAALVLTGIAAWQRTVKWGWRGGHAVALVATLTIALWPAYEEWRGLRWRQNNFPSLGYFENEEELKLWRPQGGATGRPTSITFTRARATQEEQSLRVVGGAGSWSGVSYSAGDRDWTPFRAMTLDVHNPRDPFTIYVRVDDNGINAKFADRFERGFELARGWNRIRISTAEIEHGPGRRRLNMKAIRRVAFFTGDGEPTRFWFLDNVHLETRESE